MNWWEEDAEYWRKIDMEHNKPQSLPNGRGREITPLVIKDLEMRSAMGKEKYGEALRAFNGRDALVDLYQELIDAVQYIRQAIEERNSPFTSDGGGKLVQSIDIIGPEEREPCDACIDPENCGDGCNFPLTLSHEETRMIDWLRRNSNIMKMAQGHENPVESIAQEAHRIVLGDRGEAYGHPIFDMTRSADMLTALLRNKLRPGVRLEAEDMGQAMICVKQSRHRNKAKRDNLVDTAGYALTIQMIAEWRVANLGVDPRDVFPIS